MRIYTQELIEFQYLIGRLKTFTNWEEQMADCPRFNTL